MLQTHRKAIQREEAEPVLASDWRFTAGSLDPKATVNCLLQLIQEKKKNNKSCHNSSILNDLTNKSIQKLQATFTLFLVALSL